MSIKKVPSNSNTPKKVNKSQNNRRSIYDQELNSTVSSGNSKKSNSRVAINENKNYYVNDIPNGNKYTRVVVKRKIKYQNIIIFILILAILSLIPIYIWGINKENENIENNENNENINSIDDDEVLDEWDKLLQSKNLSFYKEEFKDRYIAYRNQNPDIDLEMIIVFVNIGLDQKFYSNTFDSPLQGTDSVLVNKFYSLSSDYVPLNLETINSKYSSGDKKLQSNARKAFEAMARDASLEGYTIRAVSTYRSYSYQKNLYSNYSKSDGVEKADTYSARAGHSEHQTGLAVDVDNARVSYTSFGETKEFNWMKENAYKYGFILRYTKDNEFITGYKDEPWHYRYVGVEIATYIQSNPMTFEEYYVRFLDK